MPNFPYMQAKEKFSIGEKIRAQREAIGLKPLPSIEPIIKEIEFLVELDGVELGDEDDIVTQNIKLQAILIAILQAYNGLPKLTGVSDEYIKNFVQWIKDKRNEEKFYPKPVFPPIALDIEEFPPLVESSDGTGMFDSFKWQLEQIQKQKAAENVMWSKEDLDKILGAAKAP